MPPWKPAPGYGHFVGERRLTQTEIDAVVKWADAGAPRGNPSGEPPKPRFTSGWQLGEPGLIVEMPKPYVVPAHADDQYVCFVLPVKIPADTYVRAIEFRPSNRKILHHALIFASNSHPARMEYPCFGTPGFIGASAYGGWTPGSGVIAMPEGAAAKLRAGVDLVVQSHFHSRGEAEAEQSRIGFYFTATPPTKTVMDVGLVSKAIDIPPGDSNYKVRDHFELPVDVLAIGIVPHAHYICRDMKGWAILPDGRRRWLIWIPQWDFNWQDQYRYAEPIPLPAGTRVEMEFTYDNSAANPHNPNQPPKRVTWGGGSADEMAGLHIQVVPVRAEDAGELGRALWGKIMRMVGGRFYRPAADAPEPDR